jgi:hypothetical protein
MSYAGLYALAVLRACDESAGIYLDGWGTVEPEGQIIGGGE